MLAGKYLQEVECNLKKVKSEKENISILIQYFKELLTQTPALYTLLFDLTSMALWSAPLKELLNNLFNDITYLIDKYIINGFSDKLNFKSYSSLTLSRMVLGTLFGTSIQIILANKEKDTLDSLSAVQILFQ